jgi:dUTP pyrophosphatase
MKTKIAVDYNGCDEQPIYSTLGAAGCDLKSIEDIVIEPGTRAAVQTGLCIEIPEGFVGMVCPRSGMAIKYGVTVLNAPGIVDSDYRGEVKVILINHGRERYKVSIGDKIAQIVFVQCAQATFYPSSSLSETERSTGGFGSTGR